MDAVVRDGFVETLEEEQRLHHEVLQHYGFYQNSTPSQRMELLAVASPVSAEDGQSLLEAGYSCRDVVFVGVSRKLTGVEQWYEDHFERFERLVDTRFDIRTDRVGIWIDYTRGNGGLIATLTGPRRPLTSAGILHASLRRPFGSRRVLALIHWQALKLWWKGARFRSRPAPPVDEVTR